jgi:phosphatidate cytidylyltransferase
MSLPGETWIQMQLLVWGVLVAAAMPLAVLALMRKRRGKPVKPMWIKYGAWYLMAPLVAVPMVLGRAWMQAAFLILSLLAFEEYSRAVGLWKKPSYVWLARFCIVLFYLPVFISWIGLFMAMPAYVIILIFLFSIIRDQYKGVVQLSCLTVLGTIYFGWFLAHLAYLMNVEEGRALVIAFLFVVALNDACGYLAGSTFGRRTLSPRLSPGKTVEGFLAATLITIAVTFAIRFALGGISMLHALLLGFLLAVGGTCGDLTISLIKRDVGIKDSGSIIPGHGGVLDRLDSILFTSPIFFHFMSYFCRVLAPAS